MQFSSPHGDLQGSPCIGPRRLRGFDGGHLRSFGLSRREVEVSSSSRRATNVQAAERLGISPFTVKKHLERIYAALGAANAVVDALSHLGVRHIDIPITPWKVQAILKEKGLAE